MKVITQNLVAHIARRPYDDGEATIRRVIDRLIFRHDTISFSYLLNNRQQSFLFNLFAPLTVVVSPKAQQSKIITIIIFRLWCLRCCMLFDACREWVCVCFVLCTILLPTAVNNINCHSFACMSVSVAIFNDYYYYLLWFIKQAVFVHRRAHTISRIQNVAAANNNIECEHFNLSVYQISKWRKWSIRRQCIYIETMGMYLCDSTSHANRYAQYTRYAFAHFPPSSPPPNANRYSIDTVTYELYVRCAFNHFIIIYMKRSLGANLWRCACVCSVIIVVVVVLDAFGSMTSTRRQRWQSITTHRFPIWIDFNCVMHVVTCNNLIQTATHTHTTLQSPSVPNRQLLPQCRAVALMPVEKCACVTLDMVRLIFSHSSSSPHRIRAIVSDWAVFRTDKMHWTKTKCPICRTHYSHITRKEKKKNKHTHSHRKEEMFRSAKVMSAATSNHATSMLEFNSSSRDCDVCDVYAHLSHQIKVCITRSQFSYHVWCLVVALWLSFVDILDCHYNDVWSCRYVVLCQCKSKFIPIPIHEDVDCRDDNNNEDIDYINSFHLVGSIAREMTGPK